MSNQNHLSLNLGFRKVHVVDPIFAWYASSLFEIMKSYIPNIHGYADDHSIYMTLDVCQPSIVNKSIDHIENCLKMVEDWMLFNKLKMNDAKTEVILFGSNTQLAKINANQITIGNTAVHVSTTVKYLGARLDKNLTMSDFTNSKCRVAFYHLYNIKKCAKFLNQTAISALVNSLVHSCLDYCNVLFTGIPAYNLIKLQRVQNYAARIVTKSHRLTPSLGLLKELHWLPVRYRIKFKVLLLVYKSLNNMAPIYLTEMFHLINSNYSLRSQNKISLKVPRTKTKFGDRSLCVIGPKLWNSLPSSIQYAPSLIIFKKQLKTHLFREAFGAPSISC